MEKFYITTSIAYVNAPPHIGFALESIQADVLARHYRARGAQVFFLTGTDEHGAKISAAAEAAGAEPQKFVDEISEKFRALKKTLNLSWDDFIRTTDRTRHWPNVQMIWNRLVEAGDIYKKNYRGLYCVGHEAFVTEKDLVQGKCKDHNAAPEIIEEENYFFKLSKYADRVAEKIRNNEFQIIPESRKNEILSFIGQGVSDISFSRPRKDLSWGIPVPGDDTQTIYVWADALTNYLLPQKFWPADTHVIGKDILRFHALFWPAMLLSAKLPLPKQLFSHGFITVEGQKMSKTLGNVVDPFQLVERYGVDAVRYYLLREIPAYDDGDFSYQKFDARYASDLANGLGNFSARVLTLGERLDFNNLKYSELSQFVLDRVEQTEKIIAERLNEYKFHEALGALWELISFGDGYVNEKKPWALTDVVQKARVVFDLLYVLDRVRVYLSPFLPETSEKIKAQLHFEEGNIRIQKGAVLFPRRNS